MVVRRAKPSAYTRFNPYARGIVFALAFAGFSLNDIADKVVKSDGKHPCKASVGDTVKHAKKHGGFKWDGEAATQCNSRPRTTTPQLDKAILKVVFRKRGSAVVTAKYIKKVLRAARKLTTRMIQRRLQEAGLVWLRRRRKSIVPTAHKLSRLDWAGWVLARTAVTLARWAYTDGCSFYLARTQTEFEDKRRAALGPHVWRQASGSDGLYEDCIGPSAYWKSQGQSVRIWGLLCAGMVFVFVLPAGAVMNMVWYKWIIEHKFKQWLRLALGRRRRAKKAFLLQDHERCLWSDSSLDALADAGIAVLENYPKCSQDLNPIETVWREIRARLAVTEPTQFEVRDEFVKRLRAAVVWVNRNRRNYFLQLCSSQKELALDVQLQRGGRTKH